jgi:4-amino-4-deoxy-L-arabinose transferase-like glycosyltransferase
VNDERGDRFEFILIIGLFICMLALCLLRLQVYPDPWFDEGLSFQAAKNIALDGQYGLRSTGGFMAFHPLIQTGPTVLLPIALVFRLAGIGVLQARLVVVLYTVSALAVFYWLVRNVCNRRVAFLASLLLIFTFDYEFTSFVFMGRQVLAEVPALAFFWLGTLLWFQAWKSSRWPVLIWPGLLWGLAMLTKVQFALVLPTALILFGLFDRISARDLQIRHILVPILVSGGCMLMWYGVQMLSLGFVGFRQHIVELGSAGGHHLLHFSPRRALSAINQLLGSSLVLFGIPGMLYVLWSFLRTKEARECRQLFLVVFTVVWLGWYAFLSIGWMRYAFVPAAMSTVFSARLFVGLWGRAGLRRQVSRYWLSLAPGQLAVGSVIMLLLLSGVVPMAKRIVRSTDCGLQELAGYLNTHVPADTVIESWEWEVDFLTDHTYHHPSYEVTNLVTESIWYSTSASGPVYDPMVFRPAYLIVGSFAEWTGIYSEDLVDQRFTLIESLGEYDLYEVNTDGEG